MEYSGAGGKLIHEKNQKQKISWHCPFKDSMLTVVYTNSEQMLLARSGRVVKATE